MMTTDVRRRDLQLVVDLSRDLHRRRRSGLPKDGAAPADLVQRLTAWLDDPARGELAELRRLAGPPGGVGEAVAAAGAVVRDWRTSALDASVETLAGSHGLEMSDPRLDDVFRSWETVVLARSGYSYDESVAISKALPSIRSARRMATTSSARELGVGLLSFALSLRDRIRAEFLSTDALVKIMRDSRLLLLLGVAIEADGHALEAFDPVVGGPIARSVCTMSQLLAEIRSAHEAAKVS